MMASLNELGLTFPNQIIASFDKMLNDDENIFKKVKYTTKKQETRSCPTLMREQIHVTVKDSRNITFLRPENS